MRKIEFRGKNFVGKWCFGYYLHDGQRGRHVITDGLLDINGVVPDTIGQFTGCYDKNGKPVYEGDILKYRGYDIRGIEKECIEPVVYSEQCSFDPLTDELIWTKREFEVIGNIHDNPGLLKGGKE